MSAIEPFRNLLGINLSKLTESENRLLEIDLFYRVYQALAEYFIYQSKTSFSPNPSNNEEIQMLDNKNANMLIRDILDTQEYTLAGIAYYTNVPFEVLEEISLGLNTNP